MKLQKLFTALCAVFALAGTMTLTSCDEDNNKAYKLNGEWYGDFGMNYTYTYGNRTYRFDCYDTKIKFSSDIMYSSHGTAVQVDYYADGPYEYLYYNIDWTINNGVITLRYHWANQWDTRIYNYALSTSHFTGYFDNTNVPFDLRALYSYDWNIRNSYYQEYGYGCDRYSNYGYYPYPYYAPSKDGKVHGKLADKAETVEGTSAEGDKYVPAPEELTFGNRFTEKAAE